MYQIYNQELGILAWIRYSMIPASNDLLSKERGRHIYI